MTVLPTVRRQLQDAAEQRASRPARLNRLRRPRSRSQGRRSVISPTRTRQGPRRVGPRPGTIVVASSVVVSTAIAVLAVALLGHARPAANAAQNQPQGSGPTISAARKAENLLRGDGIGTIRFGQPPGTVAAALKRLLGAPSSAGAGGGGTTGLVPSICGFDHEIVWADLAVKSRDPLLESGQPVVFVADLNVYFKRAKFVGYSYYRYRTLQRLAGHATIGPKLATSTGLGLSDQLARARQLYGRAFVTFAGLQGTPPNPRLDRTTAWKSHTRTGLIYGFIEVTPPQHHITNQSTIASIAGGAIPDTPCKSSADRASVGAG